MCRTVSWTRTQGGGSRHVVLPEKRFKKSGEEESTEKWTMSCRRRYFKSLESILLWDGKSIQIDLDLYFKIYQFFLKK